MPKSGLKTVARKRPDGGLIRTDYYDRRTGKFLGHDRAAALAQTGAASPAPKQAPFLFSDLCTAYLGSPEFAGLAPRTRSLNRLYVDQLRSIWVRVAASAITRQAVRQLRDTHTDQPTKGNRLVATLRRVLSYGVEIGTVTSNAASKPGRLIERPRQALWSDVQIDRFLAVAGPELRRAMALMLYTVQRPADVLAMGPQHLSQRDGRIWITLRQAKTGELMDVPLHHRAAELLAEPLPPRTSRRAPAVAPALLIPSPTGRAWSYRNFARAWDATARRADHRLARTVIATWPPRHRRTAAETERLKSALRAEFLNTLQRRDMRRTGIVKLAQAGATNAQIAAVSGHQIDRVQRILDVYIPRRSEVAFGAIAAWEAGTARGQVLEMVKKNTGARRFLLTEIRGSRKLLSSGRDGPAGTEKRK
jgi:integrase